MAVSENSLKNLEKRKPFYSSEDRVPTAPGRKKGLKNRQTLLREWMSVETKGELPDGLEAQLTQQDQIVLAMIKEAKKGNVNAAHFLFDSTHGKIANVTVQAQVKKAYDYTRLSTDELEKLEELTNKAKVEDNNSDIEDAEIVE